MTDFDYAAVSALRCAFEQQAGDLDRAACDAVGEDCVCLTRAVVACEAAANALFDVMNSAKSYLDDADAGAVIDGWLS